MIGAMMTAQTMIKKPIKKIAAEREGLAPFERTVATELPQEFSGLREHDGFADVNSFVNTVRSAAHGGGWKKAGHPSKMAAVPKTRRRAVIPAAGFTDGGHPTILAATPA
jgi:hypothetical protein